MEGCPGQGGNERVTRRQDGELGFAGALSCQMPKRSLPSIIYCGVGSESQEGAPGVRDKSA